MVRLGVVFLVLLAGCSSARTTCDKVEGRLKSAVEFCKSVASEAAQAQCAATDKAQVDQCMDLIGQVAFTSCIGRTGTDRLVWILQEFCQ